MEHRTAKEFLHLSDWLARAQQIVAVGREAYDADELSRRPATR
ncbi:MAG: hypothetical protein ACR2HA_07750 [Nocardioides sp.]